MEGEEALVRLRDRHHAGRVLADLLAGYAAPDVIVVGLPRGGVPVAAEVADRLRAPLDVLLVRKLGVPSQPELAMGAIGEGGVVVHNDDVLAAARVDPVRFEAVLRQEEEELGRRAQRYRGSRPSTSLADRDVIIVDDGIATGSTALAACQVARASGARRVIVAAPVASTTAMDALARVADDVVVAATPETFHAIGEFYADFSPTTDDEVVTILETHATGPGPTAGIAGEVLVDADGIALDGHLVIPPDASGIVVFAHGSGSSRHSPRNRQVAAALEGQGLGTLLFDLLHPDEAATRGNVFDIELLAGRLVGATRWLADQPEARNLRIGYFGASTGAAAALVAAAEIHDIGAVVSRGGRPDLAGGHLARVEAPTLLIVGSRDVQVLDLNRRARELLRCPNRLEIVHGATHLFEEPGALEIVADLAGAWFTSLLTPIGPRRWG